MLPHRIRLRGPWQVVMPDRGTVSVSLAHGVPSIDACGPLVWVRTFGRPRHLDQHERIWLRIDRPLAASTVDLNEAPLGVAQPGSVWEVDVTPHIREHNRLRIMQTAPPSGWSEVHLDIRALAFLSDLQRIRAGASGPDEIRGVIQGSPGITLDLYVLENGRTLAHRPIDLTADRTSFAIPLPPRGTTQAGDLSETLRVELICGSVPWDTAAIPAD